MNHRKVFPPATIGMLGGGQLGRYGLLAAKTMGYRTLMIDPDPSAPAGEGATSTVSARVSNACAGGFSNSVVTTSHSNARRDSAC